MAAMMARQPPHQPVLDHPCGAIRALESVPAMATQGQRRVATPVEEQQALFAALQTLFNRFQYGRCIVDECARQTKRQCRAEKHGNP